MAATVSAARYAMESWAFCMSMTRSAEAGGMGPR